MVESDEEYNNRHHSSSTTPSGGGGGGHGQSSSSARKNHRDKFHRERDDSSNNYSSSSNRRDWNDDRNSSGGGGGGGSWKSSSSSSNRGASHSSGGGGYNQRSGDYSKKYSSNYDSSPPVKRRKDWDSHGGGGYGGQSHQSHYDTGYGGGNKYQSNQNYQQSEPDYPTQPPLLSFKQFLQQQDDSIGDDEAIKKYNEYKIDFKRTQINNFFLEHKEEEWFKSRYHPDENYKRRNEQHQNIINRVDVFMDLMNKGWLNDISADYDKANEIVRFLDAVVIKLEGGSDQDVKQLLDGTADVEIIDAKKEVIELDGENGNKAHRKTNGADAKKNGESKEDGDENAVKEENGDEATENGGEKNGNGNGNGTKKEEGEKQQDSGSESGYTDSESENEEDDDDEDGESKPKKRKRRSSKKTEKSAPTAEEAKKKLLHKTTSIFMRNLAPSITKQDLEALAKNYDGFKRVSLSDPAPERGFLRRGWITFESYVDVRKICYSLQNIKLKDNCNPGAIVNRELTNRIRAIPNLVAHHKPVVKNDLKLAMKIVECMDKRWNLWQPKSGDDESTATTTTAASEPASNTEVTNQTNGSSELNKSVGDENAATTTESKESPVKAAQAGDTDYAKLEDMAFTKLVPTDAQTIKHKFHGLNPLLTNITDYLVDEASAEEEELLGEESSSKPSSKTASNANTSSEIEIDRSYTQVLDKLILYLRVVHSLDFYNAIEYQQEDSMPNRCGIMFVRPSLPVNAAPASLRATTDDTQSYMKQFEAKLKPFVEFKERLEAEQAKKLGIKETREEIEKFIKVNTQELAPDRWLCPLSGKRFKGPEFIRKHLFYKHMDKIIEVKKEVEYFNNYVFDPKRPQLPEHPSNRPGAQSSTSSSGGQNSSSVGNQSQINSSPMGQNYQMGYSSGGGYNTSPYIVNNTGQGLLGQQPANMLPTQFGHAMANAAARMVGGGGWSAPASAYGSTDLSGYGSAAPGYGGGMYGGGGGGGMHTGGYGGHNSGGGGYRGGRGGYGGSFNRRGGGGGGNREMIQYKDLDAPEDA